MEKEVFIFWDAIGLHNQKPHSHTPNCGLRAKRKQDLCTGNFMLRTQTVSPLSIIAETAHSLSVQENEG